MKYKQLMVMVAILANVAGPRIVRAGATDESTASVQRIGIYDSRVVAYAQFNKLSKEMADEQERIHREVFGTAPAEEAMAALKPRLAEIQKQASVSVLVSKWDRQALESFKSAQRVDVTDLLVREFKLEPRQIKTIEEIKKQKPVPLEKIDKLHED